MKAKLDIAKSWNQVSDTWQKRIQLYFREAICCGAHMAHGNVMSS